MPQSPTDSPSVITVENTNGIILPVLSPGKFFFAALRRL
jgi:hypothetical protein